MKNIINNKKCVSSPIGLLMHTYIGSTYNSYIYEHNSEQFIYMIWKENLIILTKL